MNEDEIRLEMMEIRAIDNQDEMLAKIASLLVRILSRLEFINNDTSNMDCR